jgi:hypothetical protein
MSKVEVLVLAGFGITSTSCGLEVELRVVFEAWCRSVTVAGVCGAATRVHARAALCVVDVCYTVLISRMHTSVTHACVMDAAT